MAAMATTCDRTAAGIPPDAVLADALLGRGLPPEAARHLEAAAIAYQRDEIAEQHLREAHTLAPGHAAVLIGLYRFYFYKGRLDEALEIALLCLDKAASDNDLAGDWWQVRATDADFGSFEAILPRFYLFTLKAYAYLEMRLGHMAEGRLAVMKLLELDPSDKIGAKVLLGVLDRMGSSDDD
jgi:tetratricopeptide (TPR) repeat protein